MSSIEEIIEVALKFYRGAGKPVPNNVVEYTRSYPPGLSRQVLSSKYKLKCSDFVKRLNPTYTKPLDAYSRANVECTRLGYTLLSKEAECTTNRDKVRIACTSCEYEHTTTISALSGSVLGCPKCKSGNLPWHSRAAELNSILLSTFNGVLASDIPKNQTGYISIRHLECNTIYTTQLLGIVSPNSTNRGTCPNCRSSDNRVTINGVTFGSNFEYECFKILEHHNPELHVPYSKYLSTHRRWNCDFKINNFWIEVSNFKADFKNYFSNIEEKRALVESDSNYVFLFVTSLEELRTISSLI